MDHNIIEKFTTHLKSVLVRAYTLARELGQGEITLEHLFWSLLTERGCLGAEILQKAQVAPERLRQVIAEPSKAAGTKKTAPGDQEDSLPVPELSETTKKSMEKAVLTASLYEHKYVGTEHLLSGILQVEDEKISEFLAAEKVDLRRLKTQVAAALKSTSKFPDISEPAPEPEGNKELSEVSSPRELPADERKRGKRAASGSPALDYFTVDLTADNSGRRIDPVIGREAEIERLIQILARRTKNNPILLGDPGVGKTAIVEGLARRIAEGHVPDVLKGRRLLALDLPLVVAGTVYRGEFEGRLKQIIDEVKSLSEVILFIDEVHNIMGMGSASGSMDAANILKPALSRGEIRCIGATTQTEYKKHIETDPALERRFQPIIVRESTPEETRAILAGVRPNYEAFHAVRISDAALNSAVEFAERFLQDKTFPDKAIDLVDEAAAAARVRAGDGAETKKLKDLELELKSVRGKKIQAVRSERFAQALELKEKENALAGELTGLKKRAEGVIREPVASIGRDEIAEIVSRITGVPQKSILAESGEDLKDLEERLQAHVIGQNDVIAGLSAFLRRARAGLTSSRRPLASLLFLGPSGVGKTSLAEAVAVEVFRDRRALIRLDMSEFGESFTVSKLLGAPAGYVGYRETAKLTDAVKRRPYSVVLFDEVEKAHADVLNILLQILEDGELTDATGRLIHFKQAIIILTSNIGVERLRRGTLGFGAGGLAPDELSAEMRREAGEHFRPELLNRLDKIFVFRQLDRSNIEEIIKKEINALNLRLKEKKTEVDFSAKALALLAESCDPNSSGARAVRRIIQEKIESPLAERLLLGDLGKKKKLLLGAEKGKLSYTVK